MKIHLFVFSPRIFLGNDSIWRIVVRLVETTRIDSGKQRVVCWFEENQQVHILCASLCCANARRLSILDMDKWQATPKAPDVYDMHWNILKLSLFCLQSAIAVSTQGTKVQWIYTSHLGWSKIDLSQISKCESTREQVMTCFFSGTFLDFLDGFFVNFKG